MTGFGGVISKLDLFAVNRLTGEQHLRSPMLCQICPPVISGFDQGYLFRAGPAFQFFLSSDGVVNVVEAYVVDQSGAAILRGEAVDLSAFVFQGTAVNAVCHADVKGAGVAGHDVDEVLMVFHVHSSCSIERTPCPDRGAGGVGGVLRFAQDDRT
jgi:hypothetical protein